MGPTRIFILILLAVAGGRCFSQQSNTTSSSLEALTIINENYTGRSINIGDSVLILTGNCKNSCLLFFKKREYESIKYQKVPHLTTIEKIDNQPLKIHGNIRYNFNYRSYIDTPFAQNDLMQHFVQSIFNLRILDKYPVRITLTGRSTNSPYFKNTLDVNFDFKRGLLLDNIKAGLKENLNSINSQANGILQNAASLKKGILTLPNIAEWADLDKLKENERLFSIKEQELLQMQNYTTGNTRIQELVEKREIQLQQDANPPNFIKAPPPAITFDEIKDNQSTREFLAALQKRLDAKETAAKKKIPLEAVTAKLDSVKKKILKLESELKKEAALLKKEQKKVLDSIGNIKKEIGSLATTAGLYAFMDKHHISKSSLTKGQKILLAINQFGIGRTWIDYSELTVKNISIAGFNIEMNPLPFYLAFAAGKVNYRFRDFIYKTNQTALPSQSVALVRAGLGQKEKNNIIFTFYDGKKSVLNSVSTITNNGIQHVIGYSAETRLALDVNNYIIAEFAKSSYYTNVAEQPSAKDLSKKAFNFKEKTNEAYSIKLFSHYPATDTRFTGYFKKLGEHFQSFTLYPLGINQEAWMAKLNQNIWKKRIVLDAAIRKNDFNSPIAAPSFNSKTVFKSFQASVRIPRYPFLTVGYYPSSQLSLGNNNVLSESQYNTLNAIASYSYVFKGSISMNTNALYTKFYNTGSDTGFIYFNASTYTINHNLFFHHLQLQTGISVTEQQQLHLFNLEQNLSYQVKNIIGLSAGLKWTRENYTKNLFGAKAGMNILLKNIGTIQLNYEKIYLPAYNRSLMPVDIGQVNFYREF